ncbi:MAG TPA: hypothetical protein VMY35_17610, partial [Phycisphaerae bacterium]|nr:hypothetical protein [Phycisphaerae bacterium]
MGVTIIGPAETDYPITHVPPIVQVKQGWDGHWQTIDQLELTAMERHVSGQDLDRAQIRWRYSWSMKHPWEAALTQYASVNADKLWCRVRMIDYVSEVKTTVFVGQFSGDDRTIFGSTAHGPTGVQNLVAYGPLQILRKIQVSESIWYHDSQEKTLGWVPSINATSDRQAIVGNRSGPKGAAGTYLYGEPGQYVWNYREYLEYLLANWVADDDGPTWTVGGQVEILHDFKTPIQLGGGESVAQIIARLIPRDQGVDFNIVPTYDEDGADQGFEIQVFALRADEVSFNDVTLPVNPNQIEIRTSQTTDNITTRIAYASDQEYDTIRVLGRRIVVCCTLHGENTKLRPADSASLVPRWKMALENIYLAGDPNTKDAEENDLFRAQDLLRPVFQHFAAPEGWDLEEAGAAPKLTKTGELDADASATYQDAIRGTLSWLPLREATDYSTDPPTEQTGGGVQADFLPPAVWLYTDVVIDDSGEQSTLDSPRWVPVDTLGIGVAVLRSDWGVMLSAAPNHLLALNHMTIDGSTVPDSRKQPAFDYDDLAATIAFEGDHRLMLEKALPDATAGGGVRIIEVPGAECWFLAPDTFVGADPQDGRFMNTSGNTGRLIRNDADKLAAVMAGAIARYWWGRCRASISVKGMRAWHGL